MSLQVIQCQNCKKDFELTPSTREILEKIKVPSPTFCPQCNMQRIMLWRNERSLYRRKDSKSGEHIISIFAPEKPFLVYDQKRWWSDEWDPLAYGRSYDFSVPFFQQFKELFAAVPHAALFNKNAVASDYCNHAEDSKNCYLAFGAIWNEGVMYSKGAIKCKDSADLLFGEKAELNYETVNCEETYNLIFSANSSSCSNSAFLFDCHGCSNCFGCVNLRNKSYYIFNEPYSKEEYRKKIKEFYLGSYRAVEELKEKFLNFRLRYPHKFAHLLNSPGSTGEALSDCKNSTWCFDVTENVENCHQIANAGYSLKDSLYGYGVGLAELMYEVIDAGIGASNVVAAVAFRNGSDARYVFNCHGSSDVFGGVGLRNKQYCILNKQYTKEEYEEILPKIVRHMNDTPYVDQRGRVYKYGEFFPAEISPFAYNETVAQEYFPLAKEKVIDQGYAWRDLDVKNYEGALGPDDLPDDIANTKDDIYAGVIACAHKGLCEEQCTIGFKIIPQELEFYRKMSLPLPRVCPNCRHYTRLKQRNPQYLWHRSCQCGGAASANGVYRNTIEHFHGSSPCPSEFETSYANEKPEIIYCETCYNSEIS